VRAKVPSNPGEPVPLETLSCLASELFHQIKEPQLFNELLVQVRTLKFRNANPIDPPSPPPSRRSHSARGPLSQCRHARPAVVRATVRITVKLSLKFSTFRQ
jgi:hypothetical protein